MHLDLQDELADRYGPLPIETATLFRVIAIKTDLSALRISKLEQGRDSLVITFRDDTPIKPEMMLSFVQLHSGLKSKRPCKFTQDGRLILGGKLASIEHIFESIRWILNELTQLTQSNR